MAEAYETQAFEEVYKHPSWKMEAETFENDFTKALYDDDAVKKEGQKALVHVSNILITYNRVEELRKGELYTHTDKRKEIMSKIEKKRAVIDALKEKEKTEALTDEDKHTIKWAEEGIEGDIKALRKENEDAYFEFVKSAPKEVKANDDDGQILSSLMLGGTGIGGQGYTVTDNSIQDTRKGALYIREQMTEKGTLLNQMSLLDNAMNTGGIDLEGGGNTGDYQYGEDTRKKTLNDFLRKQVDVTEASEGTRTEIDFTAQYIKENGGEELNLEEIGKFRKMSQEEQDAVIGTEGKGENRMGIMDATRTRTLNDEAKTRKGVKQTGMKGIWNSVRNFFGGGQEYVGPISQVEEKRRQEEEKKRKEQEKKNAPKGSGFKAGLQGAWGSVKNFFAGPNKNEDIDLDAITDQQWDMLEAQGLTEEKLMKKWRSGLTEPQKRALRMLRYEQQEERERKAAGVKPMLTASGKINEGDTAAKVEELMNDRDKAIARELNEKKFLTTKDAEAVVKDPNAQTGRLMNSPKTARNMLGMYKMLTKSEQSLFNFRLALLAYLVPTRRNTIYEVLSQSHDAGVKGKEDLTDPAQMYESISPYTKEEIRQKLPGKKQFPHEKVFMTLVDEYSELRDDARGISRKDHQDLVPGQKDMSIAEVARELLNPASGLALFARLRLLTDQSITDADIKKHIDRLSKEEQDLVNEFMEKLAREQNIKFEDLKKYVEETEKELKDLDTDLNEKLPAKEKELKDVMKRMSNLDQESYVVDRRATKDLDNKARELESEIKALQEKKDKRDQVNAGRTEKVKDYNERVDWKNEREAKAVTAVNKIRKDLFGLLTATPTAYETDLEAQVPALRNRLLVITRLANRFLLDKFEETPEFEDKYQFKGYNPDREEVYQTQIKEEKAGTLGQSEATKEENRRKAEEEKARIAAEKEMRSNLASHGMDMLGTVDENEQFFPKSLEDRKISDAKMVGMAISRVINTYLNFDPSIAAGASDTAFPELIPRLVRYTLAAKQINGLLEKRGDANGALSEENLHTIRRARKLCKPIEKMINNRLAVFSSPYFKEHTGAEYEEKMNQVLQQKEEDGQEGAEKAEITKEQEEMYALLQDSEKAGEEVIHTVSNQEEAYTNATDNGQGYLDRLQKMTNMLRKTKMENDPKDEYYNAILQHMDNLHAALSETFDEGTDIPAKAAEIAKNFGLFEAACDEYIQDEKGGIRGDKRAIIAQHAGEMAKGMFFGFTAAAYRTVEILKKNNVFKNEDHLWARVMVVGAPLITANESALDFNGKLSGRPELGKESLDEKTLTSIKTKIQKDKTNSPLENRSLNRFRALLGSADVTEMKKTLDTYELWNMEDEQDRENREKLEAELDEELLEQEEEEEEQEEPEPEKPLEEQEVDQLLARQAATNIAAKEGEENVVLERLRSFNQALGTHKTGVLGMFANKERNGEVAELQRHINLFIELLTKPIVKMYYIDERLMNEDELQKEYFEQMTALSKKAHGIYKYAFYRSSPYAEDVRKDPFKGVCYDIYKLFKQYSSTLDKMHTAKAKAVLTDSVKKKSNKRYDISDYVMRQNQDGKLRYIFFLIRGGMTQGEEGYAAPEEWHTKEELMHEQEEKKRREEEEKERKKASRPFRHSVNDTFSDDEEEVPEEENQDLDESVDLDKSYDHLPGIKDEEDEKEPFEGDPEKIDQELKKLEEELENGEYEDANGEHQLKPDQQKEAKKAARHQALEKADELRAKRRERRKRVVLPTYQNIRAKAPKSKDDFAIMGGPVENRPADVVEVDIEQKAASGFPAKLQGLRTRDKVAKAAGWTLFGAIHYIGKPVKWIGNGVVSGVNFALRWTKKKRGGAGSMQQTPKIATREKQDQITNEIEEVKSGSEDQPVKSDTSRVPMNWAMETAEDPQQAPTVTVGAYGTPNKEKTEFTESHHAWMRLGFTKHDPQTGKDIRSRIDVGYGPRGAFGFNGAGGIAFNAMPQVADGAVMPGALWDERGHEFAASKTYRANNQQINRILLEAERYPAGGFNVISRNCTTFVAETTQKAGVNTSDILQKTPLRLGAKYLAVPLLSFLSPVTKALSGGHGLSKTGQDDLSFQRYGEKQITEDELEKMGKGNGFKAEAYTPLSVLNAIQEQGGPLDALSRDLHPNEPARNNPSEEINRAGNELHAAIEKTIGGKTASEFKEMMDTILVTYEGHVDDYRVNPPEAEDIVKDRKEFSEEADKVSAFFYEKCHGEPKLRVLFLRFVGVLNRTKMAYDEMFRSIRRQQTRKSFEDSDISGQLKALTIGKIHNYNVNTKEGEQTLESNPSLMIGFAKRGTSVEDSALLQKRNKGKKSLLKALNTSVDVDTANIWQKDKFSEEDTDLAFGTMQTQQEAIIRNRSITSPLYNYTGAEVMQAMIFERIYAGMKGRISAGNWFQKADKNVQVDEATYDQRSRQFFAWLKQDLEISAKSHPEEVEQIEASIGKRLGLDMGNLDANGREQIEKEYKARFYQSYLLPLLVSVIKVKFGDEQYDNLQTLLDREYLGR